MYQYNIQSKSREIATTAILIAVVFVATRFINIPMPGAKGGLMHVGTVALFFIAIIFGRYKGAIAGGIGMGLFDLLSPYAVWAPFTFIIRLFMGFIVGAFGEIGRKKNKRMPWYLTGMAIGGVWMMIGYYFSEVILYHNWYSPLVNSMPGDLIQNIVGFAIGVPLIIAVEKRAQIVK